MPDGIRVPDKATLSSAESFLAVTEGTVGLYLISALATQLAGSGAIYDKFVELTAQIAGGNIARATWADLLLITPSDDGVGGEVLDSDEGTHSAATATGYDGASVDNAGRYTWNASWGRWVRIGDTGLTSFAPIESPTLTGAPAAPTATLGTDTTQIATTAFVQTAMNALLNAAPDQLDTLNELAQALGDDPNFASTMTAALAAKADNAQVLTGSGLAQASGSLGSSPAINVPAASEAELRLGDEAAKAVTPAALAAPMREKAEFETVDDVLNTDPDLAGAARSAGLSDALGRLVAWVAERGFAFRQALVEGDSHGDHDGGVSSILRGANGATIMGYDGEALAIFLARALVGDLRLAAPDDSGDYSSIAPILYAGDGKTLLLGAETDGLRLILSDNSVEALRDKRAVSLDSIPAAVLADPEEASIYSDVLLTARGPDEQGINRRYFMRRDVEPILAAMAETRGKLEVNPAYGQSYTTGGGASDTHALDLPTIVTDTELTPHHDFMPVPTEPGTGFISTGAQLVDGDAITDLVPLVSAEWSEVTPFYGGETGFPACARRLRRLEQEAGLPSVTRAWFSHGRGGYTVAQLTDDTQNYYQNGMITLRRIKAIAAVYGRDIVMRDWHWSQGQADGGNTRAGYSSEFMTLRTQYLDDVAAITGQDLVAEPITVWMDQVAPSEGQDGRQVSLAQLDLMTENPGEIYLTAPWYFLPYVDEIQLRKPKRI